MGMLGVTHGNVRGDPWECEDTWEREVTHGNVRGDPWEHEG